MSKDRQRLELETAFIQNRTQLCNTAQAIVGARDRAEDVTQSAYLKVLELSPGFIVRQPLSYCFQVVRHLAIDYRRRLMLESRLMTDDSEAQFIAGHGSPEQTVISRQDIALVESALNELPPRTRTAFTLYRLNGLTQREIAVELGVSATLVNFLIRDAVEALKKWRDSDS